MTLCMQIIETWWIMLEFNLKKTAFISEITTTKER